MMFLLFQIFIAFVYANFLEWFIHKYIFHVLGSKKNSMWSFHWHRHHRTVRKQNYHDPDYLISPFENLKLWYNAAGKEVLGLILLNLVHLPLAFFYPVIYLVLALYTALYFILHRASHVYPSWGKKWLKWHAEHHLGKNQQLYFNVVVPFWDYIFGTINKKKKNNQQ